MSQCEHKDEHYSIDCQGAGDGAFLCRVHCADCGGQLDTYSTREPQLILNAFSREGVEE